MHCGCGAPEGRPSGRSLVCICRLAFLAFAAGLVISTTLTGRPDGTAIPGETGTVVEFPALCATVPDCHAGSDNTLNDIASVTITGVPQQYESGRTYDLGLTITGFFLTRVYGFQLAAFYQNDGRQAGSLQPVTAQTTAFDFEGRQLLTHKDPLDSGTVLFRWTAPAGADGPVVLRVASNSANGDSSPRGDHIATQEAVIQPSLAGPELVSFYFPQIGVGGAAGTVFETELIFVNTGETTPLEVDLLDDSGQPFPVDIRIGGRLTAQQSNLTTELGTGEALKLGLSSAGPLRAGYARVRTAPAVGGTAVFSQRESDGSPLYEAGVPTAVARRQFSLAVQAETGVTDTGLALVFPAEEGAGRGAGTDASLTLRLYDQDFQLLERRSVTLRPGQHLPRFATQLFPRLMDLASETRFDGSVTVESDRPLAAVTLRQTTVPTLTAFPVIPGRAESASGN